MSEPTPTVLRETKIGQKGFIKEDVITYLDELNSKIVALEEDNKALKVSSQVLVYNTVVSQAFLVKMLMV